MTWALLDRSNHFFYLFYFMFVLYKKKINESNDIIFKMMLPYNFINKSVFKYLRKIVHFFATTTVAL